MLTHAPVIDMTVCFQTVCDQRNIFTSLLHSQTCRQAEVRQSGWLISTCQGLLLILSLPPVLQRQAAHLWWQCLGQEDCYCSWDAAYWCCTLLLKSRHTVIPEERVFICFFRDCFFLNLCNIVWEAAAKSCTNVTCTFLVNEELSSCYRSQLCTSIYLFIPLTDRYGTLCTRLSREHIYSLTITHRQMYSLTETEEDTVFPEINTSPIYPILPYSFRQRPEERDEIVVFAGKPLHSPCLARTWHRGGLRWECCIVVAW